MRKSAMTFAIALLLAATAAAGDTLYVDLSGIDTGFPGLTNEQRQQLKDKIVADIQANFDVSGVDITVTTDATAEADRTVKINDSMGSEPRKGGGTAYYYGEWTEGSSSCDVYLDNFTERHGDDYKTGGEWDLDKLANGIGRTAAHEVAHSYSVGHNSDTPHNKMTEGGLVPSSERADTEWVFDDHTDEVLKNNLGKPPCDSTTDYDEEFIVPTFYDAPCFRTISTSSRVLTPPWTSSGSMPINSSWVGTAMTRTAGRLTAIRSTISCTRPPPRKPPARRS